MRQVRTWLAASISVGLWAPLGATAQEAPADGWLPQRSVAALFYGNTEKIYFPRTGKSGTNYFGIDHRIMTIEEGGGEPYASGHWYVEDGRLCIAGSFPSTCAAIKNAGDHFEGWSNESDPRGAAYRFTMYRGDVAHLAAAPVEAPHQQNLAERQAQNDRMMALGMLIVGAMLASSSDSNPQADDPCGPNTGCFLQFHDRNQ